MRKFEIPEIRMIDLGEEWDDLYDVIQPGSEEVHRYYLGLIKG